ncbi:SRPBCC family protein [Nocardia sp. NPDC020380]|uniref:SRPBCC family protein n=1 Tax=Nocardia sp. NPDC020380 TaxID=3364309 RepID=UPI0037B19565
METITIERTIAAPITDVFDWVTNSHNYTRLWPVLHEHLQTPGEDAPYGLDAVRVVFCVGACFWERITAYSAPHSFEYHIDRSFPPLIHEGGRVAFTETPEGTHVLWVTTAELRFPIPAVAEFLTRAVIRPVLTYSFGRILDIAARELTKPA